MVRRSGRLRAALGNSGFSERVEAPRGANCGACLLDVESPEDNGECFAILDCCKPQHKFHVACISTWAQQENSCPLCKARFAGVGVYDVRGCLLRTSSVEEKDQADQDSDDHGDVTDPPSEEEDYDPACEVCGQAADDEALLLCDGRGGQCNAAYHYYCAGLPGVPEGDWFCPPCCAVRADLVAAAKGQLFQKASGANLMGLDSSTLASSPIKSEFGDGDSQQIVVKREMLDELPRATASTSSTSGPSRTVAQVKRERLEVGGPFFGVKREFGNDDTLVVAKRVKTDSLFIGKSWAISLQGADPTRASRCKSTRKKADAAPKRRKSEADGTDCGDRKEKKNAKAKAKPAETFGGLCKETPKWISRKGDVVHVDLGGRSMRDGAATVLAKVVRIALGHIGPGAASSVAVHVAGNRLRKSGVSALLEAVTDSGIHVSHLDFERNYLGSDACRWLSDWCARQKSGPPEEIFISWNRIGDTAMRCFLLELGRLHPGKRGVAPIWVEARQTGLHSVDEVLDAVSGEVPICLALDRSQCGQEHCADQGCADGDQCAKLHLFGIQEQGLEGDANEAEDEPEDEPSRLKEHRMKKETRVKKEGTPPPTPSPTSPPSPPSQPVKQGSFNRDFGLSEASFLDLDDEAGQPTTPVQNAVVETPAEPAVDAVKSTPCEGVASSSACAAAADETSATACSGTVAGAESSTGPCPKGSARGKGSCKSRANAKKRNRPDPKSCPEYKETLARKAWANSLGNCVKEAPPVEEGVTEIVPLPRGLWDLAQDKRRELKGPVTLEHLSKPLVPDAWKPEQVPLDAAMNRYASRRHATAGSNETAVNGQAHGQTRIEHFGPAPAALKHHIGQRLTQWTELWQEKGQSERNLRLRCYRDQLCRLAQKEFTEIALKHSYTWESFLHCASGFRLLSDWLDGKIKEQLFRNPSTLAVSTTSVPGTEAVIAKS